MNTNDSCGLVIFKWLLTILSISIALPGYFDNGSKITFILTVCVFSFGKLIDSIEGITRYITTFHTTFCVIGSAIGGIAIGFCFYYFAAMSNAVQIDQTNPNDGLIKLISDADLGNYPLFRGDIIYGILFITLMYFFIQDTAFCGCELCQYINTKRKVRLAIKKPNALLNITLK